MRSIRMAPVNKIKQKHQKGRSFRDNWLYKSKSQYKGSTWKTHSKSYAPGKSMKTPYIRIFNYDIQSHGRPQKILGIGERWKRSRESKYMMTTRSERMEKKRMAARCKDAHTTYLTSTMLHVRTIADELLQ